MIERPEFSVRQNAVRVRMKLAAAGVSDRAALRATTILRVSPG